MPAPRRPGTGVRRRSSRYDVSRACCPRGSGCTGPRSSYVGSEVFVSLVDADQAPYSSNLRQLGLQVICTNRDLPLHVPIGKGTTDFATDIGAPLAAIRCVAGPTKPRPSHVQGDYAWRLLSHLSLNYLSLIESSAKEGAAALREMLQLYGDANDAAVQRQIDGVREIARTTGNRTLAGHRPRLPMCAAWTFRSSATTQRSRGAGASCWAPCSRSSSVDTYRSTVLPV